MPPQWSLIVIIYLPSHILAQFPAGNSQERSRPKPLPIAATTPHVLTNHDEQFRAQGRSNRSGRSQADHDVFEGLPIKQWRQSETVVGLPQTTGETKPGDNTMPELPMPRDSHLLSPWTQALLREARRPRLAKRNEATEDEKGDEDEEAEKEMRTGFLAKKWAPVPAHLEQPEREYIAKRRKGLPSMHTTLALQAAISLPSTTATRKAKVMKTDAEGKTVIYEVLVPEGQSVEGEVQQDTDMTEAAPERAAPGTVIEGVGIANAEGVIVANNLLQPQPISRRRNMPPKRIKRGGPGRGKKKVMFSAEGQTGTMTPGGTAAPSTPAMGDGGAGEPMDVDSARKEDDDGDDDEDEDDDREEGEISDGEGMPQETPSRPTDPRPSSKANESSAQLKDKQEGASKPSSGENGVPEKASTEQPAAESLSGVVILSPDPSMSKEDEVTEDVAEPSKVDAAVQVETSEDVENSAAGEETSAEQDIATKKHSPEPAKGKNDALSGLEAALDEQN